MNRNNEQPQYQSESESPFYRLGIYIAGMCLGATIAGGIGYVAYDKLGDAQWAQNISEQITGSRSLHT